jgi:hypothetical protein
MCCSSTQEDSLPSACLRGMARHFKTEPNETVAFCFGYPKTSCAFELSKLSSSVDEQHINAKLLNKDLHSSVYIIIQRQKFVLASVLAIC